MDVVLLSRLQFAMATMFHFLFVPLTLGLSVLLALMETQYVRTGDPVYRRMAKFWGKLFLINFGIGVVTGITLEFQFGTNWSRYSAYVGDIFGSLLAIEATLAFFLESTFLGVWVFGWKKLSPRAHVACIWLVALASNISAYWILAANAWMQHPVGFVIRNGRAELTDFLALITQWPAVVAFLHTATAAYTLAGFFVLGISAYHLFRRNEEDFFGKSFRLALVFTTTFAVLGILTGHLSGAEVANMQPAKLAAMESHWNTEDGAPQTLILIPDEKNERNWIEWGKIHPVLSLLAYHSPRAQVKGLLDFPREDRPPVMIVFLAFRAMVGLGFLFVGLSALGWFILRDPAGRRRLLPLLTLSIPLPYLALQLGWIVTEVGRQPWIVYGVMRTRDAASPVSPEQVLLSGVALLVLYSVLGVVNFYLLARFAKAGPAAE